MRFFLVAALVASCVSALSSSLLSTRRQAFAAVCGATSSAAFVAAIDNQHCIGAQSASAFPNKISNKYDDRPKQRGSKPSGLGVIERESLLMNDDDDDDAGTYLGLKPCKAAPDCFCSTSLPNEDSEHSIPPFTWPQNMDQATAMNELKAVLEAYQPTPQVDGGGFEIKTATSDYIYVQFESMKNGYIDDVEFAVINDKRYKNRQVQVRSASRLGYLDYGVNAKRINAIAAALRLMSWEAVGVDYATHKYYASENGLL
ncbi:hypothetical protein MPSEU_000019100 [Mayamaea pseudoterrestris]|nr:hypothetical protein MPSEU_000019100 [Mayamaea pseudoterrestris]